MLQGVDNCISNSCSFKFIEFLIELIRYIVVPAISPTHFTKRIIRKWLENWHKLHYWSYKRIDDRFTQKGKRHRHTKRKILLFVLVWKITSNQLSKSVHHWTLTKSVFHWNIIHFIIWCNKVFCFVLVKCLHSRCVRLFLEQL